MFRLARRDQDPGRTIVALIILATLGLYVCVDAAGTGQAGYGVGVGAADSALMVCWAHWRLARWTASPWSRARRG